MLIFSVTHLNIYIPAFSQVFVINKIVYLIIKHIVYILSLHK